jgi:pimeloyl-ACP methyl ester carboxylesterase
VLLVHGLDEPGGIWDALAPRLAGAGHAVARFDYPNDQQAALSADGLIAAMEDLHRSGVDTVRIVGHSMGGLLARDALTRPGADPRVRPAVPLLITVGTPHAGSALAGWQPAAELREQVQRWIESEDRDAARLFGAWHDGRGGAADDLRPGSAFLTELNARPAPGGTRIVCIVGVLLGGPVPETLGALGERADAVGDGVVPAFSASLPGADETLLVRANHRSVLRPVEFGAWARRLLGVAPPPEPPAVALILERLGTEETKSGEDSGD